MKKLFMIAAVAALGFGMASCAEDVTNDGKVGKVGNGQPGLLKIKIKNGAATTTRVSSSVAESVVNVLEVWVFEADGETRPTELMTYTSISDSEFTPDFDGSYGTELNVANGENKKVLVIANASLGNADTSLTMEEIMATAVAQTFSKDNNGEIFDDGFVMAGWNLDVDIDGETAVEVAIDRNVAKIMAPTKVATVTASLTPAEWEQLFPEEAEAGAFDGVPAEGGTMPGFNFVLEGHAVLNGLSKSAAGFSYATTPPTGTPMYTYNPSHSYLIPTSLTYANPWNNWDAGAFTYPYVAPATTWKPQLVAGNGDTEIALARLWSEADNMITTTAVDATTLAQWDPYSGWMTLAEGAPVYIHESKPGQTTDTERHYIGYNHDQVVAYIIGGTISISGTTNTATRYWRVNVREDNGEAFHLIRNSIYSLEVSSITSPGFKTPWEAENEEEIIDQPGATPTDFVISINEWDNKVVGNTEL